MPPYPRPPRQRERLATRSGDFRRSSRRDPDARCSLRDSVRSVYARARRSVARCIIGVNVCKPSHTGTASSERSSSSAGTAEASCKGPMRSASRVSASPDRLQTASRRRYANTASWSGVWHLRACPAALCAKGWPEPPRRSTAGIDAHALGRSPRAQPRVLAAARRATLRTTQLRHDRRWSPPGSFACWLRCEARRIVGARPPIAHIAACGPRHRPWPRFHASGRSDFALLAVVRIGAMNLPLSPYPHLRSPEASVFLLPRPARFLAGAARSGAWPAYRYP